MCICFTMMATLRICLTSLINKLDSVDVGEISARLKKLDIRLKNQGLNVYITGCVGGSESMRRKWHANWGSLYWPHLEGYQRWQYAILMC